MKCGLYVALLFYLLLFAGCASRGSPVQQYDPYPYYYHQGIDGEMYYRPPTQPYYYWEQPRRNTPGYEYREHQIKEL